eukprot:gene12944-8800_t
MSSLRNFLRPPQAAKHYELLHFLAQHPNLPYTLADLDERLPYGAAVSRFPPEWLEFMAAGECGNKNIELSYEPRGSTARQRRRREGAEPSGDTDETSGEEAEEVVLVCRRPEIQTLEELAVLLQPPAAQPDRDSCIGVHTDQIILSPALLQAAQRHGICYYLLDKDPSDRPLPPTNGPDAPALTLVEETSGVVAPGSSGGLALGGGDLQSGGVPTAFLRLPPGITLSSRLFTRRGVVVNDKYGLPCQWWVGERLLLTLDNRAAAERLGMPPPSSSPAPSAPPLDVKVLWGGLSEGRRGVARREGDGAAVPAAIRRKVVVVEQAPRPYMRVLLDVEPLESGSFKLVLVINSEEFVVDVSIQNDTTALPGVLLGREQRPLSVDLPAELLLNDPLLQKGGHGVLPWGLSPSPLAALMRDATYPISAAVLQSAASVVFSRASRGAEARMRLVRQQRAEQLRQEREERDACGLHRRGRGRRTATRFKPELCNTHLLFYGVDMSLPFLPPTAPSQRR